MRNAQNIERLSWQRKLGEPYKHNPPLYDEQRIPVLCEHTLQQYPAGKYCNGCGMSEHEISGRD